MTTATKEKIPNTMSAKPMISCVAPEACAFFFAPAPPLRLVARDVFFAVAICSPTLLPARSSSQG